MPRKISSGEDWDKYPEQLKSLCHAMAQNMPTSEIAKLPGLETRSYDSIRNKRNHIKKHRSRYKKYFSEKMNDSHSNDEKVSNDDSNDNRDKTQALKYTNLTITSEVKLKHMYFPLLSQGKIYLINFDYI